MLILSIALNAVLMRGIASGSQGAPWGAVGGLVSGVRFSAANLGVVREDSDAEAEAEASSGAERGQRKTKVARDIDMDSRMDRPRMFAKEKKKPAFGIGSNLEPIKVGLANSRLNEVSGVKAVSAETMRHTLTEEPEPIEKPKVEAMSAIPPARLVQPKPMRPMLALDLVDRKLEQMTGNQASTSTSTAVNSDDEGDRPKTRTFEECVDIFENGPRPVSESLKRLIDEEVIMLAQKGKIQPYALEKMLGDFTRAVKIRRALICKSLFTPSTHALLTFS